MKIEYIAGLVLAGFWVIAVLLLIMEGCGQTGYDDFYECVYPYRFKILAFYVITSGWWFLIGYAYLGGFDTKQNISDLNE